MPRPSPVPLFDRVGFPRCSETLRRNQKPQDFILGLEFVHFNDVR